MNMTLEEAIKVLTDHNIWRLGADTEPTNPKKLTEALDIAIRLLSQLKKRKPRKFGSARLTAMKTNEDYLTIRDINVTTV